MRATSDKALHAFQRVGTIPLILVRGATGVPIGRLTCPAWGVGRLERSVRRRSCMCFTAG